MQTRPPVRARHSRFADGHGGKSGELHCQFGAAVPGDLVDTPPGKARPRPSLLRPQGSPTPKFPISSNPKRRNCVIRLPPAGRSDDRTQSPASVSQKRNIRGSGRRLSGDWAQISQNRVSGDLHQIVKACHWRAFRLVPATGSPTAGLAGWRRSTDRTRLPANSVLTGNFTGISRFQGFRTPL